MEPEANSIEIMTYQYTGTRIFVELSNYHEFWISFGASMMDITFYTEELAGQSFVFQADSSGDSAVKKTFHSGGNVYPTGYAALWIEPDQNGYVYVMGMRRR
jgi:hypothetical protein